MAGRFSVSAIFKAVDRMSKPIKGMSAAIKRFGRRAERTFRKLNRSVAKFGGALKKVGVVGAAALGALALVAKSVVGIGAEFEQQLTNAGAKFGGIRKGSEAYNELKDAAAKAGRETEFTATEAASALDFLAMAGFGASSAIAALPSVIDLATASSTDLAQASDIASDALGAFGLATKDPIQLGKNLSRIVDGMAKTSVTANTNMELMMETIKDGGPVFSQVSDNVEEFLALTGELANAGIKGSKAGTTLKNMFTKLAKPVPKATKLLKKWNVELSKDGKMRSLPDILDDITEATKDMGNKQKLAGLSTIFGNRAIAGSAVLLTSGADRIRAYTAELKAAKNAAAEMAAMMRDTVMGRLKATQSAFEAIQISIFNLRSTSFGYLLEDLTTYLRKISEVIDKNPEMAASMVDDIGGSVMKVLEAFAKLTLAFIVFQALLYGIQAAIILVKGVMLIWKGVTIAFTAIQWLLNAALWANPIGFVIVMIIALIAAGVLLAVFWDDVVDAFKRAWDFIVGGIKSLIGWIGDLVDGISSIFGTASKLKTQVEAEINYDEDAELQAAIDGGEGSDDPSSVYGPAVRAVTKGEFEKGAKSELIIKGDTEFAELVTPKDSGITLATSG